MRAPGGGRPKLIDKDPSLLADLDALVEPETRGDPMCWTTKSTEHLARALRDMGHGVSADTVGRLLRTMGYSLQAPAKSKPICERASPSSASTPRKKEVMGNLANKGREYQPKGKPVRVDVHDFPDPALGKAVPYGVFDLAADAGFVVVGSDGDTAAFAVATIGRWWDTVGTVAYPEATRLLITADAGNSATTTMTYDGMSGLVQRVTPDGRTVSYGYDKVGNMVSLTDPGGTTYYAYNAVNLATTVTDPGGLVVTLGYDASYNRTSVAFPNGYTQYSTYDTSNRLTGTYTTRPPSPSRYTDNSYSYLRSGYQTALRQSQSDQGTNAFDSINRLVASGSRSYSYDPAGNRGTQVMGSQGVNSSANGANELVSTTGEISLVGTTSGGDGGLNSSLSVALPGGIQANDQIMVGVTESGYETTTAAGYTLVGTSAGSLPGDAKLSVFRRTATGGETQVSFTSSPGANFVAVVAVYRGVDPTDPLSSWQSGAASTASTVSTPGPTTAGAGGRVVLFHGAVDGTPPTSWSVSGGVTEQLQDTGRPLRSAGVGDRAVGPAGATSALAASLTTGQNLPANLAAAALALRPAPTTYAYDANGNLTGSSAGATVGYDTANRTTTIQPAGQAAATFTYRGPGQAERATMAPVTRVNGACAFIGGCAASTTTIASSASFEHTRLGLSAETRGAATTYYVRDPRGGLLGQRTPGGAHYYLLDGQGSVVALTNTSGAIAATYAYDPFGQLTSMSSSGSVGVDNPWRYTGAYQDGTGLYKLGERYYDPTIGRFTQQDPIHDPLDPKLWNRYTYVGTDTRISATSSPASITAGYRSSSSIG